MKEIKISSICTENRPCIRIEFHYDKELIRAVKKISGARWNYDEKFWYVRDTALARERIRTAFDGIAVTDLSGLPETIPQREYKTKIGQLSQEKEKLCTEFTGYLKELRYSDRTIDSYTSALRTFIYWIPCNPDEVTNETVNDFIMQNIVDKDFSSSSQNIHISAIKLFYRKIQNQTLDIAVIERPRKQEKLPKVISKQAIKKILGNLDNLKHKAMISTAYACGLRRSEVLNLKIEDIDSERMVVIIRQAKGNKDRIVGLPMVLLELLRDYYLKCRPRKYLFEGDTPGEKYSESGFRQFFQRAVKKSGIKKKVTLHTLRHSYATHQHESGTDIRTLQEILGHKSSKTTEIYTHVSMRQIQNVRSPFEDL